MANVLTNIASDMQIAAEKVGRSAVGFIPSVTMNAGSEAAAQNQTVNSFTTTEGTINESATPSMTIPEGDDITVGSDQMTLNKVVNAQIPFTGEETALMNAGAGYATIYGAIIQRKLNGMMKKVEAQVALAAYQAASRAFGTAGTNPFASNFDAIAESRQILFDNDVDVADGEMSLIVDSIAGTKLRNQAQLQKVNESGSAELLRQGTLLDLQGAMLKESSQVQTHAKGTGTGYQTDAAFAVGVTTISIDTGSGTVLAGDVVSFAGDTNKYVVKTALSGGAIVIGAPGLREALADNVVMTVGNSYTGNVMLKRSAIELAIRPMKSPIASAAQEQMIIQDPHSGIAWQIEVFGGYKKAMIDITAVYGVKAWNPHEIANLLG